jgi:xanthine dehydrogenase YagT iron-sulfur-binding subunit
MAKHTESDQPRRRKREQEEISSAPLGRREFVKLVGSSGMAVSAGVLAGEALLRAEPTPQQPADASTAGVVGPGPVRMTLSINKKPQVVVIEPRVTLLDLLRDHLQMTGAKKVCDRATCGACTVIINGRPMYSCTVLAIDMAERPGAPAADIETIEGIGDASHMHPVSAAFVENDAQQCGFCTAGFVMAAKAYLDRHPQPTYDEVKAALGGNFCRCGTYMGVRHAVVAAGSRMEGGKA